MHVFSFEMHFRNVGWFLLLIWVFLRLVILSSLTLPLLLLDLSLHILPKIIQDRLNHATITHKTRRLYFDFPDITTPNLSRGSAYHSEKNIWSVRTITTLIVINRPLVENNSKEISTSAIKLCQARLICVCCLTIRWPN